MRLRVAGVHREAEGVISLELVDPTGAELPPWEPGSHLELVLPSGLIRHYSLCGRVEDRSAYRVAVLRVADGRGGSMELHDSELAGQELEVRGPRNHFPLVDAPHYLLLAGGIGVTPLLSMARRLQADGRPWRLVYGGRTTGTMAFTDEVRGWGAAAELLAEDEVGLPNLVDAISAAPPGTAVYCCGPSAMISLVEELGGRRPDIAVHVERFTAGGTGSAEGQSEFQVELRRSGKTVTVRADESILDVVRKEVPDHLWACEEGACGSCEAAVLDGVPEHRCAVLDEEERAAGDAMMICVSRSLTPLLVLDI